MPFWGRLGKIPGLERAPRCCDRRLLKLARINKIIWVDNTVNPRYSLVMEFGQILRDLRARAGIGIKRLAPDLGVTYSYLSKLETSGVRPSEELIGRVATYFGYDRDRLFLSAGRVPPELLEILRQHPDDAIQLLKERFRRHGGSRR